MVVDDLDVVGVAADPTEADTELVVDADAVLTEAIADEFFETVGWRHRRLLQRPYGRTDPLSMVSRRGESGARDMRLPVTNFQRRARDALQLTFAPVGAAKPANEFPSIWFDAPERLIGSELQFGELGIG